MQIRTIKNRRNRKTKKTSIFKAANALYKAKKAGTIGEALRIAWKAAKLQLQLSAGEVKFRYRKMNGEIREAVGTLKDMVTDSTSAFNGTAMYYFDIEKKGFRSFAIANLI